VNIETSIGTQVDCVKSQPMEDKPFLKGAWLHHVIHFKFFGAPFISQDWLKLMLSNLYTHGLGNIKSYQTDKNHPKRGVVMVMTH